MPLRKLAALLALAIAGVTLAGCTGRPAPDPNGGWDRYGVPVDDLRPPPLTGGDSDHGHGDPGQQQGGTGSPSP
jgi:hypothetical protein